MSSEIRNALIQKGVHMPNPDGVTIDDAIDPDRISGENVTIHPGCRLAGRQTLILKNCIIGEEAPVTMENVLLGEGCRIKGGYFNGCVFSGKNTFGSGAHVRQGTILEEEASAAHTVGLKQTILFPFVTLGSLINFCDCFMAGGTSRQNHSEIGSSFIHFNYTPNQDKATPSMMGDVVHGVMLDSHPIFLGGQGGIVGPVKIAYGCISAAGSVIRRDELKEDRLILGGGFKDMSMARQPTVYKNLTHIVNRNIEYIAQLITLKAWYHFVRPAFGSSSKQYRLLVEGMQQVLDGCINERISRFRQFFEKVDVSRNILSKDNKQARSELIKHHEKILKSKNLIFDFLEREAEKASRSLSREGEVFVDRIETQMQKHRSYMQTIQGLDPETQSCGIRWLGSVNEKILEISNTVQTG